MKTAEDVESYLIQMDASYEAVQEQLWVVKDMMGVDVVISMSAPLLVFRAKVLDVAKVPEGKLTELYQKLLELNVTDMLHGAYGLEKGAVVITNALPLENLDYNEFQSTVDDIELALTNHYQTLSALAA